MKDYILRIVIVLALFIGKSFYSYGSQEDSLLSMLKYQKDTSRINTLNELLWYYRNSDLKEAKIIGFKALKESQDLNYYKGEALAHQRLGIVFRNMADYEAAQDHLLEALRIYEKNKMFINVVKTYVGIGNLYSHMKDYPQAYKYYLKVKPVCLKNELYSYYSITCNNIGFTLENMGENDEALAIYKEGLSYIDTNFIDDNYYNLLLNIGSAYANQGQIDSGIYFIEKAKNKYLQAENYSGVGNSLLTAGYLLEIAEQYNAAIEKYNQGVKYAIKSRDKSLQRDLEQNIMLCYGALGVADSMYFHFEENYLLNDELIKARTNAAIQELSIKYEVEKKEQNLQLAENENERIKLVGQLKQETIYILIVVILIITLITVILLLLSRQRQKINKLKVTAKNNEIESLIKNQEIKTYSAQIEGQEKERKRIADDLHDRIGGLLATINLQFEGIESDNDKITKNVRSLLDESIKEVRSISHNLSNGRIDNLGLKQAVENLRNSVVNSEKFTFDLFFDNYNDNWDVEKEHELYKVILELLSNTLKHSEADHIVLQINSIDNKMQLIFEENGLGFDPSKVKKGLGMRTISQRIDSLMGSWYIDSKPGHGSTTIIDIPIQ